MIGEHPNPERSLGPFNDALAVAPADASWSSIYSTIGLGRLLHQLRVRSYLRQDLGVSIGRARRADLKFTGKSRV